MDGFSTMFHNLVLDAGEAAAEYKNWDSDWKENKDKIGLRVFWLLFSADAFHIFNCTLLTDAKPEMEFSF